MYKTRKTVQSKKDVRNLAAYMMYSLKNKQAADHFLHQYYNNIHYLKVFPYAYQSIDIDYQGHAFSIK